MLPGRSGIGGNGVYHGIGAHRHHIPCPVTPGTGRRRKGARSEQDVIACDEDVRGQLPRGAEMARCGLNRLDDPYGFGEIDGRYETGLGVRMAARTSWCRGCRDRRRVSHWRVMPWRPGPGSMGRGTLGAGEGSSGSFSQAIGTEMVRRGLPRPPNHSHDGAAHARADDSGITTFHLGSRVSRAAHGTSYLAREGDQRARARRRGSYAWPILLANSRPLTCGSRAGSVKLPPS